jgi:hypothetical protein
MEQEKVKEIDCRAAMRLAMTRKGSQSRARHCEGSARSNPEKKNIKNKIIMITIKNRMKQAEAIAICIFAGFSCVENDTPQLPEQPTANAAVPKGAFPIMDTHFRFLWSSGYIKSYAPFGFAAGVAAHCETDQLNGEEHLRIYETAYNGIHADTVTVQYHNVAFNPSCTIGSSDTVSSGYILFDRRKAEKDLELTGSEEEEFLEYVSVARFSLSATSVNGSGMALYKSINLDEYRLVGYFMPKTPDVGEWFSVALNESNINLKFIAMGDNEGYIRMHDLQLYGEGVPKNATLYAEEYFNDTTVWQIEGYPLPLPPIPYVDYEPEIGEGEQWTITDENLKGISFVPDAANHAVPDISKTVTYPSGVTLNYTVHDGAVNPYSYNHHGDLSLVWGLTKGYIDLPVSKPGFVRQDIDASLEISGFPSVSFAEFWLSTDSMDCNHEIWYKAEGFDDYRLLTRFAFDRFTGIGKYLRVKVNAENVSFRICPGEGSRNNTGYRYNGKTIAQYRKTKVHGIRVWSK